MSRKNRAERRRNNRNNKNKNIWYQIDEEEDYSKDPRKFFDNYNEKQHPIQKPQKNVKLMPRGANQVNYVANLLDQDKCMVFAIGPAGCGKTMLAMQAAVKGLVEKQYDRIIVTRPNIAVDDKDIGFLPGDIMKKMAPWIAPLVDVLKETYSPAEVKKMFADEIIEVVPIAYMRGRTFKRALIIVDEAQNTTPSSLLSILTRIGEDSKMVITGDLKQTDHKGVNGLQDFLRRYEQNAEQMKHITVNTFGNQDIQRHPVISVILDVYKDVKYD
jgi:phosphate starvation-inducible PhoH-like protein